MTTEQRTIEFHEAFRHPVRSTPQTLCRTEALLALKLIEEEFLELAEALFPATASVGYGEDWDVTLTDLIEESPEHYVYQPNLIEVADALADLDVVINGAGIRHGFDMQALSREVFASNMSKLDADGKPIYHPNGKIAKSDQFREPDISGALGLVAA